MSAPKEARPETYTGSTNPIEPRSNYESCETPALCVTPTLGLSDDECETPTSDFSDDECETPTSDFSDDE